MDPFAAERAVRSRRAQFYAEVERDALRAAVGSTPNIGTRLLATAARIGPEVGRWIGIFGRSPRQRHAQRANDFDFGR